MDPRSTIIAEAPTALGVLSAEGELLFKIPLAAGVHPALAVLGLVPPGCSLDPDDNIVILDPKPGYGVQPYGKGSHESGANPDFQPTSASRLEKQMRLAVAEMQATTARLDAREKALAKIERIPTAPTPAAETGKAVVE